MTDEREAPERIFEDRECGITLDRTGRFFQRGEPVTHARLAEALHRWIDLDEATGRYVLRAGRDWCFLEVEDTPFFVRGVAIEGEPGAIRVTVRLSDGSEEELAYDSLRQAADNVLYCDVKRTRMPARFDRAAYYRLAEHVVIEDGVAVLPAAGGRWPIRRLEPTG